MTEVRCGRDAVKSASTTETAVIEAGSDVGFHIKVAHTQKAFSVRCMS